MALNHVENFAPNRPLGRAGRVTVGTRSPRGLDGGRSISRARPAGRATGAGRGGRGWGFILDSLPFIDWYVPYFAKRPFLFLRNIRGIRYCLRWKSRTNIEALRERVVGVWTFGVTHPWVCTQNWVVTRGWVSI